MDTVGLPLKDVIIKLDNDGCKYTVERTYPTRDYFPIDEEMLYVVRQKQQEDGSLTLVVAATMRKEV